MKYLGNGLSKRLANQIGKAQRIFLFLDYDGTLTSLKPRPEMALLPQSMSQILGRLARHPRLNLCVISGRKISTLRSLIRLKNVIYAGNHGLEIQGPDFYFCHPQAMAFQTTLKRIQSALRPMTGKYAASWIENKKLTLTFHYRQVNPGKIGGIRKTFFKTLSVWLKKRQAAVLQSKKALEVRPAFVWNKGHAVQWILKRQNPRAYPIYIGDDITDEDAFKSLRHAGLTIRVGHRKQSAVRYFVKDIDSVKRFLLSLLSELKS